MSEKTQPGQPELEIQLIAIAIEIAADAPLRRGTYVSNARIPWSDINTLRDVLDAAGIDWRKVKAGREAPGS